MVNGDIKCDCCRCVARLLFYFNTIAIKNILTVIILKCGKLKSNRMMWIGDFKVEIFICKWLVGTFNVVDGNF